MSNLNDKKTVASEGEAPAEFPLNYAQINDEKRVGCNCPPESHNDNCPHVQAEKNKDSHAKDTDAKHSENAANLAAYGAAPPAFVPPTTILQNPTAERPISDRPLAERQDRRQQSYAPPSTKGARWVELPQQSCSTTETCNANRAPPSTTAACDAAQAEPVCPKCKHSPGTCNPCPPMKDLGVLHPEGASVEFPANTANTTCTSNSCTSNTTCTSNISEQKPLPQRVRPRVTICTQCTHSKFNPSCTQCSVGQKAMFGLTLEAQFKKAVYWVRHAPHDIEKQLREHHGRIEREALYYQITEGDCTAPQPWAINVAEREQWDAWNKLKGTPKDEAIKIYLSKISEVDPHWMENVEVQSYLPALENPLDAKLL